MPELLQKLRPILRRVFRYNDALFDRGVRYGRRHWRLIGAWALAACFLIGGLTLLWAATLELPDLASLESRRVEQSVKIYDRTGQVLLYDLHNEAQRTVVPLQNVAPSIQQAVVAIENPNFYTDAGIEPTAIARAILTNASQGDLLSGQGGSTITQQVVKLTVLTTDKTVTRKLKEWILALKMTRALSKDQILEIYLNQVPFGGQLYGVEEAAETFFGVHASDLTVPEAAYLAGMLPAPTRLSPYGTHQDQLEVRKNLVLQKMFEHGYITQSELDEYKKATVTFVPQHTSSIAAPHFVFYVQQYLEDKYGQDALEQGGWRVTTTLDADLQQKAEEIVNRQALANVAKFNATNMAMTAVDPQTGQILVMVGSRNYFDTDIPGAYNVATTKPGRQPGSAFKPFVYAQAFSEGYTPDTILFDVRTQFSTACGASDITNDEPPCYSPVNYDGKFRGPMTLRDALAQSINIPAVKLLYLVGINDALKTAKALGISTLSDADHYGLTLVLGGGEVTPLEMTSAYGTFAADGVHYETTPILKIEDPQGNVIEDNTERVGTQVLAPEVAQKINDVLSDPVARAPLGENELFTFAGHDVAVKTGTTNDFRDAWTVGYTPNIAVGIWAGNNDNTPMQKKVSGFIVGPAWSEFMRYALNKLPNNAFDRPQYAAADKPVLNGNWQVPGQDGRVHEILYWINKGDPTGPPPANPADDPQFLRWDAPVQAIYGGYSVQQQPTQPQQQYDQNGQPVPQQTQPNPFAPTQPQTQQQSQGQFGGSFVPQ